MESRDLITRRTALAVTTIAAIGPRLGAIDTREPAPKFRAKTLDGEPFNNDSLKGKVVLFQFWATWCKYCRGDQSAVDDIAREYADRGLIVLAINVGESKKKVKRYLEESPRACKVVLTEDTNLAAVYAARSYPLYVLVDRDGYVAGTQNGAGGEEMLRRLLKKAGLDPQ
jgi:thiol-disulfide isomerase/thioredoxin